MSTFTIVVITGIIFLIILVLYYISIQYRAPDLKEYIDKHSSILNWVDLSDFMKNADNGDLILMSGNTRGERVCRYFTDSIFSHVGLLFREIHPVTGEDILYIWDSDLGQKTKDGPRILPLKDKLSRYHGYHFLSWRRLNFSAKDLNCSTKDRPTTENILKIVEKYKDYDFDEKMLTWWTSGGFLSLFNGLFENKDKLFCSQLIALTLQSEGILNKDKKPAWYSPGSFTNEIEGLNEKFNYGPQIFCKF
jgi:hypothetical protein